MSNWSEDNHQKAKDKFVLRLVADNTKAKPVAKPPVNPYPCAWATIPPDDEPSAA